MILSLEKFNGYGDRQRTMRSATNMSRSTSTGPELTIWEHLWNSRRLYWFVGYFTWNSLRTSISQSSLSHVSDVSNWIRVESQELTHSPDTEGLPCWRDGNIGREKECAICTTYCAVFLHQHIAKMMKKFCCPRILRPPKSRTPFPRGCECCGWGKIGTARPYYHHSVKSGSNETSKNTNYITQAELHLAIRPFCTEANSGLGICDPLSLRYRAVHFSAAWSSKENFIIEVRKVCVIKYMPMQWCA